MIQFRISSLSIAVCLLGLAVACGSEEEPRPSIPESRSPHTEQPPETDEASVQSRPAASSNPATTLLDDLNRSLEWLASQQHPTGFWSLEPSATATSPPSSETILTTALATLAFRWASPTFGESPSTTPIGNVVRQGIRYLSAHQQRDGFFGDRNGSNALIAHTVATYLFADAYLVTGTEALIDMVRASIGALVEQAQEDESGSPIGWMSRVPTSTEPLVDHRITYWAILIADCLASGPDPAAYAEQSRQLRAIATAAFQTPFSRTITGGGGGFGQELLPGYDAERARRYRVDYAETQLFWAGLGRMPDHLHGKLGSRMPQGTTFRLGNDLDHTQLLFAAIHAQQLPRSERIQWSLAIPGTLLARANETGHWAADEDGLGSITGSIGSTALALANIGIALGGVYE